MASVTLVFGTYVSTGPGDDFEPGETLVAHLWAGLIYGGQYERQVSGSFRQIPPLVPPFN
jgi:hypothetical protein